MGLYDGFAPCCLLVIHTHMSGLLSCLGWYGLAFTTSYILARFFISINRIFFFGTTGYSTFEFRNDGIFFSCISWLWLALRNFRFCEIYRVVIYDLAWVSMSIPVPLAIRAKNCIKRFDIYICNINTYSRSR